MSFEDTLRNALEQFESLKLNRGWMSTRKDAFKAEVDTAMAVPGTKFY